MGLQLITAATSNPVSLIEAKAHCYVEIDDDDTYIAMLIAAATGWIQKRTSLQLIQATYEQTLDVFPGYTIKLDIRPLSSVSSVKYYDVDGTSQTVATSDYWTDAASRPAKVVFTNGFSIPEVQSGRPGAVQVRYVAGYASASDVPPGLKLAILELLAHWYSQREAVASVGNYAKGIPYGVDSLCDLHSAEGYV